MMDIKNITTFGAGVLGCQIAFQTAFSGFNVTVYDIKQDLLEKAKERFKELGEIYQADMGASPAQIDAIYSRITYTTDLAKSVENADLTIESIPEDIGIKKEFYTNLGKVAPQKTIFCTNSSTLLPSQFSNESGRPDRFLALHFANKIWKHNMAEIMGHSGTDPKIFEIVVQFAKAIGMVPIPIYKEQPGYINNSLFVPLLYSALYLYGNNVANPETIDKTWIIGMNIQVGPFAMMDTVGLVTVYNVIKMKAEAADDQIVLRACKLLKENYIDNGKLGLVAGEGFYKYPNPNYLNPDFLK